MEERFSAEEWMVLERVPVLVFMQIAAADGKIQDEESAKFVTEMLDAESWRDPLLKELLLALAAPSVFEEVFRFSFDLSTTSAAAVVQELEASKRILHDKLRGEEYQRFVASVLGLASKVAEAHAERKRGLFGRKKELPATSEAEQKVIGMLMVVFGFDPELAAKGFAELGVGGTGPSVV